MHFNSNDTSSGIHHPAAPGPPIVCIVGYSGSGKTTLMVRLIQALVRRGYKVGTVKHDSQGGHVDHPGKDSFRHKAAGAATAIIASPRQVSVVADVDHEHDPEELLGLMGGMDIVLAEGYKRAALPKIEVYRPETGKAPACKGDARLLAVVSAAAADWGVPCFAPADIEALVDFLVQHVGQQTVKAAG
ncbi:MAG: molybdopterin-guanine dinucleotide biosynthesis protein B [Desulfobacterales bacterium]|nr:molybdopterin-guanine dinucleotide biosynthesis protein B [Desulfobacterales bacterium]